eukprot:5011510-Amphidinium_carterae.1
MLKPCTVDETAGTPASTGDDGRLTNSKQGAEAMCSRKGLSEAGGVLLSFRKGAEVIVRRH